jgi:Zn-dependent M28 family amino/carboxypeptidase
MHRHSLIAVVSLLAFLPAGLAGQDPPAFDTGRLMQHIKALSADEFEGRAPGGKGEQLTVDYLVGQFKELGLEPGNTDGTFIQKVPLVGIAADAAMTLTLQKGSETKKLGYKTDFVASTRRVVPNAGLSNSDLVFVGYGVVAPEFTWDDYKGLDVAGKTLVMLVNDPPVPDPSDPSKLDAKTFGGVAMTYYGRWTYKYDIGADKKAAGVLIVHETGPAGYPWAVVQGGFTGERFNLSTPDKNMDRAALEGWITVETAQALFQMAGKDFEAARKAAVSRDFKPMPLGITASVEIRNTLRTVDSQNVVARLVGGDAAMRDEHVIYTAHWDHLGIGDPVDGDRIYNGAVDNGSGTSVLIEMARAFKALPKPPRRSILFLAVTAEEQGLLGSQYYAEHPIYPLAKTLAAINMDALNVDGRTRDVVIVGLGNSELDDYAAKAAARQDRVLKPDAEPEKGFYYRSDHFNFAKQGVPALNPDAGVDFIGKPAGFGQKVRDDYTNLDYHKPSDEVKPGWDLSGLAEDAQLFWLVGYGVAEADRYPEWKTGTEFKATRDEQLRKAGIRP